MGEPPTEVQGRIFISYRRDDTAYPAGWLFDRLAERFGEEQIFKDVDSIELGDDFVEVLNEAVGSTHVLLALIGEKWLTVTGEDGRRRLDDPDDFVRLEIEAALRQKVRVIPILVEGAEMPDADEVPSSLKPLVRRQAMELSSSRFTFDTDRLLVVLERILAQAGTAPADAQVAEPDETREPESPPEERTAPPKPPEPPERPGWRRRLPARPRLLTVVVGAVLLLAIVIGGVLLIGGDGGASPTTTEEGTPTPPAASGGIAYVSDGNGGGKELWKASSDGSQTTMLTTEFAEVRNPDWSPDGTKLAFASNKDNSSDDYDLWIVNADGEVERKLTDGPASDGAPSWSPDGCNIAFGRATPGEAADIWIVDAQGREESRVTDDPADDDAPDWSETNLIAFETRRDGHDYDIYTLDPTGLEKDVTEVTRNGWNDWFPDWSPDARTIAYRSYPRGEDSDYEIFMIDVPDGLEQRLTVNDTEDHRPDWSPDGKLIAFDSVDDGSSDINAVNVETGVEGPLISGDPNDEFASWGNGLETDQGGPESDESCTDEP
jgi:Tol biopolymer transport system component